MERGGGSARAGERRSWLTPFRACAIACVLVLAELGGFAGTILRKYGQIAYPLDDVFIHLSIAKHLANDGVYGVTKDAFAAASSSIAWPWILAACDRVVGDHVGTPLVLNALAMVGLLATVTKLLKPHAHLILWTLLAMAFLTPLATMAMLGMEHVAHAWAIVALVAFALRFPTQRTPPSLAKLALLAAATTALRYESLGVVALVIVVLFAHERQRALPAAVALMLGAALPPMLFALFAHAHGAPIVPTSVLMKAHGGGGALGLLNVLSNNAKEAPHLLAWLVALAATRMFVRRESAAMIEVTVGAILVQLVFGRVGWFFRYEAYLVVLSICALARAWGEHASRLSPTSVLGIVVLLVLPVRRAAIAQATTVAAAGNIHDQQMRTAAFLQMYFPHDLVAVNDIGAVSYFRDGPLVDLLGLADENVARARGFAIDHALPKDDVTRLTAGAKVAVVYDEWFTGAIPDKWTKIATWTIANNRVCAFPSVAIYAADPAAIEDVRRALE